MEPGTAKETVRAIIDAAQVLADAKAGWVNRRDAAELLGDVATRAWTALQARRNDPDVDVRMAVQKKLTQGGAAGLVTESRKSYSLEELARACDKPGARTVTAAADGYLVDVVLRAGRRQQVYVSAAARSDGAPIVRVYTRCGGFHPDAAVWALRANAQLSHGAIALEEVDGAERFILVDAYLADEVTPRQIKASVKELAKYGDWIEQRLTGKDEL